MKRSGEHVFDAPIEQVWAMVRDVDAHVAKAERAGHRDVVVADQAITDDHVHIELDRTVTIDLPSFAKKVMKPTNRVRTIDEWNDHGDGTYGGGFHTDFRGAPVRIAGITHLEADGAERTRYRVEIEVEVKVPMLGRKLESFATRDVDAQIANEFAAGDAWLAGRG